MSKKFFLIVTLTIVSLFHTNHSSQAANENLSVHMQGAYSLGVDYRACGSDNVVRDTLLAGQSINVCAEPGTPVNFFLNGFGFFAQLTSLPDDGIAINCWGTWFSPECAGPPQSHTRLIQKHRNSKSSK